MPGKSQGQRSLAGYSPGGHKELNTTEHTTTKGSDCNSLRGICSSTSFFLCDAGCGVGVTDFSGLFRLVSRSLQREEKIPSHPLVLGLVKPWPWGQLSISEKQKAACCLGNHWARTACASVPRDLRAAKGKGKVVTRPQGAWQAWEGSDGRPGSLQGTRHPVLRAESQFWHCLWCGAGMPMTHFMEPFCDSGPRSHRQSEVGERCWFYQGGLSRLLWFGGPFDLD